MKEVQRPVVLFVGDDADISKVTIPDDSLLVGYDARPADRKPQWVLSPEGDEILSIWHADHLAGLTCPQCQDTKEKAGFLVHHNEQGFIGVFQCSNCGLISFPQWRVNPPKNILYQTEQQRLNHEGEESIIG